MSRPVHTQCMCTRIYNDTCIDTNKFITLTEYNEYLSTSGVCQAGMSSVLVVSMLILDSLLYCMMILCLHTKVYSCLYTNFSLMVTHMFWDWVLLESATGQVYTCMYA
jgi:hypothetical protein